MTASYHKFLKELSDNIASIDDINYADIPNELLMWNKESFTSPSEFLQQAKQNGLELLTAVNDLLKKQEHPYIASSRRSSKKLYGSQPVSQHGSRDHWHQCQLSQQDI